MAHCVPLLERPRSAWIFGAAIETMVWPMNVIATAKIIAVRIRLLDRPPVPAVLMALMVPPSSQRYLAAARSKLRAGETSFISQMTAIPAIDCDFRPGGRGVPPKSAV